MSSNYEGTPNYPDHIVIPDDGDARNAASVNPALEALRDTDAYIAERVGLVDYGNALVINATTNGIIAPDNAVAARVSFFGGGGGGAGGGAGASASTDRYSGGGGGGGAAARREEWVPITGGGSYDVVIGDGGAGGEPGVVGVPGQSTDGEDGGDTIFKVTAGAEVVRARGATGGRAPSLDFIFDDDPDANLFAAGGTPTPFIGERRSVNALAYYQSTFGPGFGAMGLSGNKRNHHDEPSLAFYSVEGFAPGASAAAGADDGTDRGGGPGGAGAAGPGGIGGDAGAGGDAAAGDDADPGANGGDAPANSGAGGGGGGGGGAGGTAGGGGAGGAGGSGKLTIVWILKGVP